MLIQALQELAIAGRMSDIEQRMTIISGRKMLLSNKTADVANQQLTNTKNKLNKDNAEIERQIRLENPGLSDEEIQAKVAQSVKAADDVSASQSDVYEDEFDFNLKSIQAAELTLDIEKERLEVEYKALQSQEEGTKKLKDKNIQQSFGYMKN